MKGVTAFEKPAGKKRFFLRWRDSGTGRKRARAFLTDAEREKFARGLMSARNQIGKQALRFSHAGRLAREEVDFARKGIILAASKHKSRRRGYLEGLPDNLWKWLEAAPEATWEMTPVQYMHAKSKAFVRAGVKNAGNVLRHSFGSYLLAFTENSMKTAEKMQHTSPVMLYRHYKGVASQEDAKAWFAIVPPEA